MVFKESPDGLYYHDTAQHVAAGNAVVLTHMVKNMDTGEMVFVDTVTENQEGFTKQQIAGAKAAWDAYKMLGFPSMHDFESMVRNNRIHNCPITIDDIKNAYKIYGPDITSDYISVPWHIFEQNQHVIMAADIMYVNGIKFLVSLERDQFDHHQIYPYLCQNEFEGIVDTIDQELSGIKSLIH